MKWTMRKQLHLLVLGLGLLALSAVGTGCNGLAQAQQAITDGRNLQAEVHQANAEAATQLAAATQPAQIKVLSATTQGLTATEQNLGKALDVADNLVKIAQAKSVTDPDAIKAAAAIVATAVPTPYGPLAAAGIPVVAALAALVINQVKTHNTLSGVVASNSSLANAVTDAHATLLNANQTIATLTQPPPPAAATAAGQQ